MLRKGEPSPNPRHEQGLRAWRVEPTCEGWSRRAGSMKCCLACFLLLAGADAFRIRVESSLGHFSEQTWRHVPSRVVAFGTEGIMNNSNNSSRRRKRGGRTADGVCLMAMDPGMEIDSRIRGDPAALERWLSGGGAILGPVVLEGESHFCRRMI